MWTRLGVFCYTVFSRAIFILMNAERRCKKARCLSAASKRSEQLWCCWSMVGHYSLALSSVFSGPRETFVSRIPVRSGSCLFFRRFFLDI